MKIYVPALEYEIKCFLSRGKGLCWKLFLMRISGRIDVRGILHRQVIKPAQQLQPCGVRLYNLFSYWGTKGMDEIFDLRQQQMTPNSKCASITRLPLNERIHRPFFDWEIVKKKKTFFLSPFVLGLFLFTSPGPIWQWACISTSFFKKTFSSFSSWHLHSNENLVWPFREIVKHQEKSKIAHTRIWVDYTAT